MRVLQLVKTSHGAPWAYDQMRDLVARGIEVHVAVPPGGPMVEKYQSQGIHTHLIQTDIPIRRPWRWPAARREFLELVRRVQPDLIHSHFVGTTLTMRLALGRGSIPRIFQVPGPLHLEHSLFARGEIGSATRQDYWIAACRWTRGEYHRRGIPSGRVFLCYYGRDTSRFVPTTHGKLRAILGIDASRPLIGMVAFMYSPKRYLGHRRGIKGHEDLIDAVAIASEVCKDLRVVFIGGSWDNPTRSYERQLHRYAARRIGNKAVFLGTRDDVPELYPDLDVACHPSHSENVGGADESLLMGVPTVATHVGGIPDVILPGQTGWLVPPKSPSCLAGALVEALGDRGRAKQYALEGQALIRRLLDLKRTGTEMVGIYSKILERA